MIRNQVNNSFAPILIHTYTRIDHLKNTINALLQNNLVDRTDLIIASDFPRTIDDIEKVAAVRRYINSIVGFKSLKVILRDENLGPHLNSEYAIDELFKKYDCFIGMEDDIVTGKFFLNFMNQGLNAYKNDHRVLAVSGYMWKNAKINGEYSNVLLNGFSAWGFATWKDKYYSVGRDISLSKAFISKPLLFFKMMYSNPGLIGMVVKVAAGKLDAGDVNWNLHIIKNNKLVLFPKESLTRNIGWDGTGVNCSADNSFMYQSYSDEQVTFQYVTEECIARNKRVIFYTFGGYKAFFWNILISSIHAYVPERILNSLRSFRNNHLRWS